jgi:hypothetical protein
MGIFDAFRRKAAWPQLATVPHVSGRLATLADVGANRAAFVLEIDGGPGAPVPHPASIIIPQYAYHLDRSSGKRTPEVIVQAEELQGQVILGMLKLVGSGFVAAPVESFSLLGTETPLE